MTLRQFAERYGPTALIGVLLVVLVLALPGNAEKKTTADLSATDLSNQGNNLAVGETTDTTLAGGDLGGTASTIPSIGGGGGGGGGVQTAQGDVTFGATAGNPDCRADGRQKGISKYMPPCVKWNNAPNNYGTTAQGVTKDKILVVRYVAQSDPATDAILKGAKLSDDPDVVLRAYKALFNYSNNHFNTYGRQVVFQDFAATGASDDDEKAKADAATIATTLKPFAVFNGGNAFGKELAARGVVCICTVTLSSDFYKENPPNMWGSLPTSTEYAQYLAEFVSKRLAGKNAIYAGDEVNPVQRMKAKPRKFGLIYLEGIKGKVDPEGKRAADAITSEFQKKGVTIHSKIGYTYDPGRNQQDLTTMIAKLNSDGVTSVIMLVDPLYPILITGEATRQQYYPEWIISGSGLSDTTAAGRLYDQTQWKHALGISPLWVTWNTVSLSTGYREAHNGDPSMNPGDEGVLINIYNSVTTTLFRGIQMAGPKLTADTFKQGMFNYPKTGGTSAFPLVYHTREFPTSIKDFIEVYYDGAMKGVDERGLAGTGEIMKMNQGKRYQLGQWPTGDAPFFGDATAISTTDTPPGGNNPTDAEGGVRKSDKKCLTCA